MIATASSSQPSLRIALIGAGKIGSAFAYKLAHAGHELTVIARPGSLRLEQLQRDRGVVLDTGERVEMRVDDALDEAIPYDLVIVTTLAHQIGALVPALERSRALHLHFMSVNFHVEHLAKALGEERCSFGMPFIMAWFDGEGRLKSTISSQRRTLHGDQRWVDLFNKAGLPSAFEPDMALWLRCHTPMTIAFESIAVAAQRRGEGASWAQATIVARGLHGGFEIVRSREGRLYPRSKAVLASCPVVLLAALLWLLSRVTSFRDLLATGLTEARDLADELAAAGANAQPPLAAAVKDVVAMKPPE